MERKEPHATQEEYSKYVIRYTDVPTIELFPGIKAHIISADRITLSFANCEPNAQLPSHRHVNEQMLIVLDGAIDLVVEGKQYHVEKGDVVVLPSNTEHGAHFTGKGARVIDVFSPPRQDFVAKLEEVKKSQKQ
ncbi:MAG TPA: cupin domain-containing protein [Dehalococcoidales bacterium]|nr:cupin domain-containing protein [Dehalococcoidales bacterium]